LANILAYFNLATNLKYSILYQSINNKEKNEEGKGKSFFPLPFAFFFYFELDSFRVFQAASEFLICF